MKTLPIDLSRRNFDRYVADVAAVEVCIVTRHGKPLRRFMASSEEDVAQFVSKPAGSSFDEPKI